MGYRTQSLPVPAKAPISAHAPSTPINHHRLAHYLRRHPDRDFVHALVHDFTHGCSIGFSGPRLPRVSPNLPSAYAHPDVVERGLQRECDLGHMAGPYDSPPLPNLQCSGLGVVPKRGCMATHNAFVCPIWVKCVSMTISPKKILHRNTAQSTTLSPSYNASVPLPPWLRLTSNTRSVCARLRPIHTEHVT